MSEHRHCAAWEVAQISENELQIVMSEPHGICTIVQDLGLTDLDRRTADLIVRACHSHAQLLHVLGAASHALKSYAHGNASPELAEEVAAACDAAIARAKGDA